MVTTRRKGRREGPALREYSRPSMRLNRVSAPAWCAVPRDTGTWESRVAMPNPTWAHVVAISAWRSSLREPREGGEKGVATG